MNNINIKYYEESQENQVVDVNSDVNNDNILLTAKDIKDKFKINDKNACLLFDLCKFRLSGRGKYITTERVILETIRFQEDEALKKIIKNIKTLKDE